MFQKKPKNLLFPLHGLFHMEKAIPGVIQQGNLKKSLAHMRPDQLLALHQDLLWAKQHPDYKFSSFMPGIGHRHTEKEIYGYLETFLQKLEEAFPELSLDQGPSKNK
jgi:hypothetical protein